MSAAPETWATPPLMISKPRPSRQLRPAEVTRREAVKVLIVANGFLDEQIAKLHAAVSMGYAGGRFELRGRKDWYD